MGRRPLRHAMATPDIDLVHPFPAPPAPGEAIAVAPGILWMRLPLPFRLDHVNIYAIEDGDGWAIVDAGIGSATTREHWERLLAGPLSGRPLTRLIVTHYHPDHVGAAGWLAERHGLDIEMSATDYLESLVLRLDPGRLRRTRTGPSTRATGSTTRRPRESWGRGTTTCAWCPRCRAPIAASLPARPSRSARAPSR
jgi:glyoxylase-like metal-dependent hydrolase (beta-lactamase superfamily II)